MNGDNYFLRDWQGFQRGSLIVGMVGLLLSALGLFFDAAQFFRSYLQAFVFWNGVAVGCLGLMMLHNLSGGAWGIVIRRLLESGMRTLPFMLIFFLPLLFGMNALYEWARPEALAEDPLLQQKSAYLNVPFFILRAAVYFVLWIGAAHLLTKWSRDHDRTADPRFFQRLRILSAPGLILYALTVTFASIDWMMSLEPHWFSTIYGIHFMGGHALSAFAFAILLASRLAGEEPLAAVVRPSHFQDLGNLMLAFVMLWAYFAFSQWLIIWSGNLPEETSWYAHRTRGGWEWIALTLMVFHFFLPFLLLLLRTIKRRAQLLGIVAAAILFMRLIDIYWYTAPAFYPEDLHLHWLDVSTAVGLGGIWFFVFLWQLRGRPLLALHDPALAEVLAHGRS
jgi:hypothetical protein